MAKNKKNLKNNQSGAMVLIFALFLIPLVITVLALNVDLSRMQLGKSNGQSATDAAALATLDWIIRGKVDHIGHPDWKGSKWQSWAPSNSDIAAYAAKIFKQNLSLNDQGLYDSGSYLDKFDVQYNNSTYTLEISNCTKVQSIELSKSLGLGDEQKVCNSSVAAYNFSKLQNIEVAFSLDVTGSMFDPVNRRNGRLRIESLHYAMTTILDKYFKDPANENYASIAPFRQIVSFYPYHVDMVENATLIMEGASTSAQDDGEIDESLSITDANLTNPTTLKGFDGNNFIKYRPYQDNIDAVNCNQASYILGPCSEKFDMMLIGQDQRERPENNIQPLTNDYNLLTSYVNKMTTNEGIKVGGTSGLPGIYGAWLTLAPGYHGRWNKPSFFESSNGFTAVSRANLPSKEPGVKKYLIHISDGDDNNDGLKQDMFRANWLDTEKKAKDNYQTVCDAIKKNDIEIFIIIYGPTAQPYHQACASDSTHLLVNLDEESLDVKLDEIFVRAALDNAKTVYLRSSVSIVK